MMAWRSDAALSLSALGDARTAAALCDTEVALARRWGAGRALGVALRAAGLVAGGDRGLELLTEAVAVLRPSPAPLELARALIDLGAAHRRAGSRAVARDLLREGLDIAHGLGSAELAARARAELVIAGGRPRRDAVRGRDALTPSELRVAQLAAAGQTNRQIAQTLFVTLRTVENHLTSSYAKLGISSRPQLAAALAAGRRPHADRATTRPDSGQAPRTRSAMVARCRSSVWNRKVVSTVCFHRGISSAILAHGPISATSSTIAVGTAAMAAFLSPAR